MTVVACARESSPRPALLDEGQWQAQFGGEVAALLGEPKVHGRHDRILQFLGGEVVAEQVESGEDVAGDREEALDLPGVQIDGHVAVGAGDLEHVGQQAGGDGDAGLVLLVGASVAHVRDDGRDAPGRIALEAVDHDQELHDIAMERRGHGLDHIHVLASDAAVQADEQILVRELDQVVVAQRDAQVIADLLCQITAGGIRRTAEYPRTQTSCPWQPSCVRCGRARAFAHPPPPVDRRSVARLPSSGTRRAPDVSDVQPGASRRPDVATPAGRRPARAPPQVCGRERIEEPGQQPVAQQRVHLKAQAFAVAARPPAGGLEVGAMAEDGVHHFVDPLPQGRDRLQDRGHPCHPGTLAYRPPVRAAHDDPKPDVLRRPIPATTAGRAQRCRRRADRPC